jgi:hypothetical protein
MTQRVYTPDERARLERRRVFVRQQLQWANGEYGGELTQELAYLNRVLGAP